MKKEFRKIVVWKSDKDVEKILEDYFNIIFKPFIGVIEFIIAICILPLFIFLYIKDLNRTVKYVEIKKKKCRKGKQSVKQEKK